MREKFGDSLNVHIHTLDSEAAQGYSFKSSTNVLFEDEWLSLDLALDADKMENFLSQKLSRSSL
jgi:hypothetical protein